MRIGASRLHDYRVERIERIAMAHSIDDQRRSFTEFQLRAMVIGLRMEISSKREDGSFLRMSGKVAPIAICKRWGFKSRTRVKLYAELCDFARDNGIKLAHNME